MAGIELGLTLLSCVIWIGLLSAWGQFWRIEPLLEEQEVQSQVPVVTEINNSPSSSSPNFFPSICAVIPARNEADLLPMTLQSLLCQDYQGTLAIFLVDDNSTDGTATAAIETAKILNNQKKLHIISGQELPPGWTGKLWAMEQGVKKAAEAQPDYFLLTDADIEHNVSNLRRLVNKAVNENLDLVSIMVRLRCENFWEKFLIPAFVFFFQKLYPFRWVNNPLKSTAAAAGGCILIKREALLGIGGLQILRTALIDDCSLAAAVKGQAPKLEPQLISLSPSGRIWLGLSNLTCSLRPYPGLKNIWDMVARTAYTQLNYSPLLLIGTLLGMTLVYLVPPLGLIFGLLTRQWLVAFFGLLGWLLMSFAYSSIVRFYKCSIAFVFSLPIIALLYTLMTLDSGLRHYQGRGGAWKGRVY